MLKDFFINDEDDVSVIGLNVAPRSTPDRSDFDKISECVDKLPLAMAYVPMQRFEKLYSSTKALEAGTLFEALDLPYMIYPLSRQRGNS